MEVPVQAPPVENHTSNSLPSPHRNHKPPRDGSNGGVDSNLKSGLTAGTTVVRSSSDRLQTARQIMLGEASAIVQIASQINEPFLAAVDAIVGCSGQIVVSGMGKAGLIGQKISATLASTGTRSIFLHPSEAVHGDLGRLHSDDILLLLSYSGETEELNRLLPALRSQASLMIAMTSSASSTLGKAVDHVLALGALREVCPLGLAPSTSTTAMLALGDALALSVSDERGFTREAFARNHPAGNLGRQLAPVDQVMRPLATCRVAHCQTTLCDVLVSVSKPGRRSGAVMLVNDQQQLVGIFTDSDLARLLEQKRHAQLDAPIAQVMTTHFRTISSGSLLSTAIDLLSQFKISELPVIDEHGAPLGLIDITDVVSLVAHAEQLQTQNASRTMSAQHSSEDSAPSASQVSAQSPAAPIEDVCVAADGQVISLSITTATAGRKSEHALGRHPERRP